MDNKEPIEGDVRYKPVSWTCGTGKGALSSDNSYGKTIQFTTAGTYNLNVTYERQAYKNGKWVKKGEADVQTAQLNRRDCQKQQWKPKHFYSKNRGGNRR